MNNDERSPFDGMPFWGQDLTHISADLFQSVAYPEQYPADIQVHREHPALNFPVHWHPGPEVIYSRNRELTIMIDGKKYLLIPGDFILISSYSLHATFSKVGEERQDVMSISFQLPKLESMMPNIGELVISRDAPSATEEAKTRMRQLCEQIRSQQDIVDGGDIRFFITNQLLYMMLQLMYSAFLMGEQKGRREQRSARRRLTEVLAYLDDHFQEPLTTQSMADQFGYTREYFCRLFKNYSNQTFKQYLTQLRLTEAVKLLEGSSAPVGQIGIDCGFPDEKSFFAAFKRAYGLTPAQYRAQKGNSVFL
ncbi:MAG: AraC family transcriptional regulator [Clostridiales bacterium]|nr:AraC family transcriptional regulator [Clostridiales bacterium]